MHYAAKLLGELRCTSDVWIDRNLNSSLIAEFDSCIRIIPEMISWELIVVSFSMNVWLVIFGFPKWYHNSCRIPSSHNISGFIVHGIDFRIWQGKRISCLQRMSVLVGIVIKSVVIKSFSVITSSYLCRMVIFTFIQEIW